MVIVDPKIYRLLALKAALYLECKGMRNSRGSVYATVKREFGFRGDKQSVYTQLCGHIDTIKIKVPE